MIIVKVELHSARTGEVSEIGRAIIHNDGTGSPTRGNYICHVLRRGQRDLRCCPTRSVRVRDFPRRSYSVWRLVLRALRGCFPEEN
jgi:hypothetical protein